MKKTTWIATAVFAVVAIVFIFCTQYIKSQKHFKVVHFSEVKSEVGPDGRAAVGSPEVFQVQISPALAWEKGDHNVAGWRNFSLIMLILSAVYIALAQTGVITGSIQFAFVGLAISLASYFAAYSSAFSNNYKEISAQQYELLKDNPAALKALFDKPLIK
jgi:hypothetical protein